LRKVYNLEELLKRLEHSVTKLETENANLKELDQAQATNCAITDRKYEANTKIDHWQEKVEKLEQQLQALREEVTIEKQTAKQAQLALWKKEKELSDANLDKRIAVRESKRAEDRIKILQEEKQKLQEKLSSKIKEEEENLKKLLKELDIAKMSLNDITKEASRNKMQADSAQRVHMCIYRVSEKSPAVLREVIQGPKKEKNINIPLEISRFRVTATFMLKKS